MRNGENSMISRTSLLNDAIKRSIQHTAPRSAIQKLNAAMDRAIPPWQASRLDAAVNATNKPMPATVSEIGKKAYARG